MRNWYFHLFFILLLSNNFLVAQSICGFDKSHQNLLISDIDYVKAVDYNEKKIQEYIAKHPLPVIPNEVTNSQSAIYIIPVVIHVMHTGDQEGSIYNPSKEQLLGAIDYLNKVYNGTYPGTQGAGDLQIQFELAKRTPSSDCTDGINRVNASSLPNYVDYGVNQETNSGCTESELKNLSRWNTDDYYNIWVVNKIDGEDGTLGQFIAGFAYFPGSPSSLDGTVMLATQMIAGQKTLPHEIGHALNLYHTFNGSNNSTNCPYNLFCSFFGDKVCDTDPVTQNVSNGVYNFECRTGINTCTGTQYNDNTESNYMAYTFCYTLFTFGQKQRLHAAMTLSSRETLVRSDNLALISPNADLIVINQQTSTNSISPGGTLTAYFSEANNGAIQASSNFVNFHLSQDDILTPGLNGDIYLAQAEVNQVIYPFNETIVLNKQVSIPISVNQGVYYLFFAADGTGAVNECIEDNNFATVLLTVSNNIPSSQSGYKFWFDNFFNSGINFSLTSSLNYNIQKLVSTTGLANGLHTLNFQFRKDTLSSSIVSTFFYKSPFGVASGNGKYEYWADGNYSQRISKSNPNSSNIVIIDSLEMNSFAEGLHTLNIRFKPNNSLWSSVSSSFFYKVPIPVTGIGKYQYWFDFNSQDSVTTAFTSTNNFILLDSLINTVSVGLHTLNIRFKPDGGLWSSIASSFFYKNLPTDITNNTIARCVYWYDNNWQNPNLVYYNGQQNLSSIINADAAVLNTGMHRVSMMFRDERGLWSSVVSDSFNRATITSPVCPFNNKQFISQAFLNNNAGRQWQVDMGAGFVNLTNNANYTGVSSDTLQLINAPTSWYGYKYRCVVSDGSTSINSQEFLLKFFLIWNGAADSNWENAANWSCGTLPDGNVDVIVNSGVPLFPKINSTVYCRSLTTNPGVSVTVNAGSNLIITH